MAGGAGHRCDRGDRWKWIAQKVVGDSFPPIVSVSVRRVAAPVESVVVSARGRRGSRLCASV